MRYHNLGNSELNVSLLCLGSMTWGEQNTEVEAHAQIDYALANGVNCIDTAELYSVLPIRKETQGASEAIIGTWLQKTKRRDDVILMTKIAGINANTVRENNRISPENIDVALNASLKRLQTDYVDLYQLHWPNRGHYHFRRMWDYDPSHLVKSEVEDDICETLERLTHHVKAGKIRYIGLSNETAWGVMTFLNIARKHGFEEIISTQNEYSLLYRAHEPDLQEVSAFENIGLLAYSPLAGGLLTGKYGETGDIVPEGSRRTRESDIGGRVTKSVWPAIRKYQEIAKRHGLNFTQMALAFAMQRPFMGSVIFGATQHAQLVEILEGQDLILGDDVIREINQARREMPFPF